MENNPVPVERRISGRYLVEQELGTGHQSATFAAMDLALERRVIVRRLHSKLANDARELQRFLFEAQALAQLDSEHIPRVFDVARDDLGVPYMVSERIDGISLRAHLDLQGALLPSEAVQLVLEACEALIETHRALVVHRALTPDNLILAEGPDWVRRIKVTDFGVAARYHPGAASAVERDAGMLHQSPHYMAPEQLCAGAVDARADIWALGVILYELVSGRRPFVARTLPSLYATVLSLPPEPLSAVHAPMPAGLRAVIQRCLQKDPDARYASVVELKRALGSWDALGQSRARPWTRGGSSLRVGVAVVAALFVGQAGAAPRALPSEGPALQNAAFPLVATAPVSEEGVANRGGEAQRPGHSTEGALAIERLAGAPLRAPSATLKTTTKEVRGASSRGAKLRKTSPPKKRSARPAPPKPSQVEPHWAWDVSNFGGRR